MADAKHNTDTPFWATGSGVVVIVIGLFVLFSLFAPTTQNITILSNFRSMLSVVFDTEWFFTLRTISGILVFGLAAFSFWLFLRIREMELEHAEHVYPHHVHEDDQVHVEKKVKPIESHIEKSTLDEIISARSKTAPPPLGVMQQEASSENGKMQKVNPYIPKHLDLPARKEGESTVRGLGMGEEHPGQHQWQTVLQYISSPNPSDWKIAVIQADTILDEMTYMAGIGGETVGERLRNADPGLFKTLSYAKEAHNIRNQIAHNGFEFEISARDARRAIKLYEEVFTEFKYI